MTTERKFRTQVIGRAKCLEKRLIKTGFKTSYDEQLKDFIARKAVEKISDEELRQYKRPVNYVDHHGVLNDSNTTPSLSGLCSSVLPPSEVILMW